MMSPGFGAPLRFFFKITLKRHDLAEELISTREPRRLPVVLSPEEVGRLLAAATNTKHRAILSLAYATGLRASEVVSLKLTDIDRDRMLIRVEQGKGKKDRYVGRESSRATERRPPISASEGEEASRHAANETAGSRRCYDHVRKL